MGVWLKVFKVGLDKVRPTGALDYELIPGQGPEKVFQLEVFKIFS